MGKGNLLQGMGRGKLGDTVFYRANGSQMFRMRNRIVKNPKSVGQQIQRSLMATVTKAYSQLQIICNHSFENVAYGAASQAYFVKKNLDLLRKAAITYSENNLSGIGEYNMPYIVAPGSVATVCPNRLVISEGSLVQGAFTVEDGTWDEAMIVKPKVGLLGTVEEYLDSLGDNMYTLVVVRAVKPFVGTEADKQGHALWSTEIIFSRIKRNDVPLSEEDSVKKLEVIGGGIAKYLTIESNMANTDRLYDWFSGEVPFTGYDMACCVIASKFNGSKWLRSSASLVVNKNENFNEEKTDVKTASGFGLDFAYGLDLWTGTSQSLVTSNKLLNGGNFAAYPDSIMPVG